MNRIPSEIIKKVLMFYITFTKDMYDIQYNVPGMCEYFNELGYNTFWRIPGDEKSNYREHMCLFKNVPHVGYW